MLNVVTGNLDRPGGAMFAKAAAGATNTRGASGSGRGLRVGRHQTRVRGLGETMGELPVACLAEEIDTPGPGQIRAMVTVAGFVPGALFGTMIFVRLWSPRLW